MSKNNFFEQYLEEEIELDNLDEAWRQLPSVYHHYSDLLTEAAEAKELASVNLDKKKAELDDQIRRDPDGYNLVKSTETAIAGKVLELVTETNEWEKYLDARKEYSLMQNKIKKLDKKDRALSKLVDLFISSYFIGPKEPKQISFARKQSETTTRRVRKKLNSNED